MSEHNLGPSSDQAPQTTELKGLRRKAAVSFIFITVLLDVLGLGVIIPVLPRLMLEFTGSVSDAAQWGGVMGTTFGLLQFFSAPFLGALSDRFGRRPVILISCLGMGLDYLFMWQAPGIWWLLFGRVISGITAASFTTAGAYIADITAPENRAKSFGMLGAAFGLGFILGPLLGGLVGADDHRMPFLVAGILSLLNFLYGMFVLPESLPEHTREPFRLSKANPLGAFSLLNEHKGLMGLAFLIFLANFAHMALQTGFVLYGAERYGWDSKMTGILLGLIGLSAAVVQGGLVGPIVKALGPRNSQLLGLVCGAVGFAIYGFAQEGWQFFIGIPIMAFWGVAGPATQQLMTQSVPPQSQGRLAGANSMLMSLATIVGPMTFGTVFSHSSKLGIHDILYGANFFLAASLLFLCFLWAWFLKGRSDSTKLSSVA